MHRRTNSYSYTAVERVPPACTEFSNTASCNEGFVRGSKERRSLDRVQLPLPGTSKLRHRGYLAVNVSQAVPATIKYAITEDACSPTPLPCKVPPPSILTMQRPRSPSKSSRMGVSSEDSLLDQALADIREQLVSPMCLSLYVYVGCAVTLVVEYACSCLRISWSMLCLVKKATLFDVPCLALDCTAGFEDAKKQLCGENGLLAAGYPSGERGNASKSTGATAAAAPENHNC